MDKRLKFLVIHFLTEYGNDLSDNTCNDLDINILSFFTDSEKLELLSEFNSWKITERGDDPVRQIEGILDYQLVRFLAYKLSKEK